MEHQPPHESTGEARRAAAAHFAAEPGADTPPAWEEVAAGRYMPRRFKGSNKGRALG
ncbi:MAG TPA: hypothetical protein VGF55_12750 [Gemmataceae bacterium]|jgi:hypothetical protein